jgi:hypothetical protein
MRDMLMVEFGHLSNHGTMALTAFRGFGSGAQAMKESA